MQNHCHVTAPAPQLGPQSIHSEYNAHTNSDTTGLTLDSIKIGPCTCSRLRSRDSPPGLGPKVPREFWTRPDILWSKRLGCAALLGRRMG